MKVSMYGSNAWHTFWITWRRLHLPHDSFGRFLTKSDWQQLQYQLEVCATRGSGT